MRSRSQQIGRLARLWQGIHIATGADRAGTRAARQKVVLAAERFLIDTCEACGPDLPATVLMDYLIDYRAHLAAVVAASRRPPAGARFQRE